MKVITLKLRSNILAWLALFAVVLIFAVMGVSRMDVQQQTDGMEAAGQSAKGVAGLRWLLFRSLDHRDGSAQEEWRQAVGNLKAALHSQTVNAAGERVLMQRQEPRLDEVEQLSASFLTLSARLDETYKAMRAEIESHKKTRKDLQASGANLAIQGGQLARAQQELQLIIDRVPALIVYWDKNLRNRFANKAYVEWSGTAPDQMRGLHIKDVVGAARYDTLKPHLGQGTSVGKAQSRWQAAPGWREGAGGGRQPDEPDGGAQHTRTSRRAGRGCR
jgi:PAS domain-containing protein